MRKIFIVLLVIGCLSIGVLVFAATHTIKGTSYTFKDPNGDSTTLTFTPSTNVTVGVNSVAQSYAANSKHLNGDRIFGGASDSTSIFWQTADTGVELSDAPSGTGASSFSGWNSL